MATTAAFKNGLCLQHQGSLYTIKSFQHVKPGKGGAFVRTELKHIKTGRVIEHTFNAGVKVDLVRVERHEAQYSYHDPSGYHFMDQDSFEMYTLQPAQVEAPQFLKEGHVVQLLLDARDETVLKCELPSSVELAVTYTEPGTKGDTATRAMKPATLETGATLQVPLFIQVGDLLKVDTRTGTYSERISKA